MPEDRCDARLAATLGRPHRSLEATEGAEQGSLEGDELGVDPIAAGALLDERRDAPVDVFEAGEKRRELDGIIH